MGEPLICSWSVRIRGGPPRTCCLYLKWGWSYGHDFLNLWGLPLTLSRWCQSWIELNCWTSTWCQNHHYRTSLVVQWIRVCLPMQVTWVWSPVCEDSTWCRATKSVVHSYWARVLPATEAHARTACALQQEKSLKWEDCAPQWRPSTTKNKVNK